MIMQIGQFIDHDYVFVHEIESKSKITQYLL